MFKMRKKLTTTFLAIMAVFVLAPLSALADEAPTGAAAATDGAAVLSAGGDNEFSVKKNVALAIGLGLGLAAAGGAIGQGRCAAAAVEGIARNPGASGKVMVPMILGLALIESLVIYSLVISFGLMDKL